MARKSAPDRGLYTPAPGNGRLGFFVPAERVLDLLFFRRVFIQLLAQDSPAEGATTVTYHAFRRTVVRLLKILGVPETFDPKKYDRDSRGVVGWFEFIEVWRDQHLSIQLSRAERVFLTLDDPSSGALARGLSMVIMGLIIVSSVGFILSTHPGKDTNE